MAESSISKRVIFGNPDLQIKFLLKARRILGAKWATLPTLLKVHPRTLQDWAKDKFHMSFRALVFIAKISGIAMPRNLQTFDWKDHLKRIGAKGGRSLIAKYGRVLNDEKYRKEKWTAWWNKTGKFREGGILKPKKIRIPQQSNKLAEFIGIMLGDGGVAPYHIAITLNINEKSYANYIVRMLESLFRVKAKIYYRKSCNALDIVVSRKLIADFCAALGLKRGSKIRYGADIPLWIKNNSSFGKACVRGLIDTDGSIFTHSYVVNSKRYNYLKLCFTNRCEALLESVYEILKNLGFSVRIASNNADLVMENQSDVKRYLEVIGTNNPRYKSKLGRSA